MRELVEELIDAFRVTGVMGLYPPDFLFENAEGTRGIDAKIEGLAIERKSFDTTHPFVLLRVLLRRKSPSKGVYRISGTVVLGEANIDLDSDVDQFTGSNIKNYVLVIINRDHSSRGVLADLIRARRTSDFEPPVSALGKAGKINAKKGNPNIRFFQMALSALAAVRMGHAIDHREFDVVRSILEQLSKEQRKELRIPYGTVSSVYGGLKKANDALRKILPQLRGSQLKLRSYTGNWTIK